MSKMWNGVPLPRLGTWNPQLRQSHSHEFPLMFVFKGFTPGMFTVHLYILYMI